MKKLALILTILLLGSQGLAGGSIFGGGGGGHKTRTSNPNGVESIGVHICGSLKCPDVIIRRGDCEGIAHASMKYGVCLCSLLGGEGNACACADNATKIVCGKYSCTVTPTD